MNKVENWYVILYAKDNMEAIVTFKKQMIKINDAFWQEGVCLIPAVSIPQILLKSGLYYKGNKMYQITLTLGLMGIYICQWEHPVDTIPRRIDTNFCQNYHTHHVFETSSYGYGHGLRFRCR